MGIRFARKSVDWFRRKANVFSALFVALAGCVHSPDCEMLPKERFLREQNNETRTYTLWETSIEALNREARRVATQGSHAYLNIRAEFTNNVELIEYLNEELDSVQFRKILDEQIIEEMEEKMNSGDTLYLFELSERSDRNKSPVYGDKSFTEMRKASGMLILNRKGKLVWREIEEANYPYHEEEPQYEELNRVLQQMK